MSKVFTIAEGLENLGALRTGGQGSVYKGRRTGSIYTAVKLIPTPVTVENEEDKNYRNFRSEVAKLEKVNADPSPHVVKMLSWGITESGSFPYIEMEYIDGPDLCDLLQPPNDGIFTLKELLKVALQVSAALAHCHRAGVKHGDIKSNNIKYNRHTGNYVLLDFGLAMMSEEQRRSSVRHAGAIEFMAPEQLDGKMLFQTDIYSFGIMLYELFTGTVPFPLSGNSDTGRNAVMLNHLETAVPDALAVRRANLPQAWSAEKQAREMQAPAWFLSLLDVCLAKSPDNRYKNAMELQDVVINGSLSSADGYTAALHNENESLRAQLEESRQAKLNETMKLAGLQAIAAKAGIIYNEQHGRFEQSRRIMQTTRPVFMTVLALALGSVAFLLYSFFAKPDPMPVSAAFPVGIKSNKPYYSPYIFIKSYNYDSVFNANRKVAAKKPVSLKRDQLPKKDSGKKKKRKRFLGVF
ncbi:serine/threonine protein kinase [Hufsiella ginkgonis]|uniref:Protein kinase n=1 Tax=Hufsiella ginkgonis TaxID=2695274 RepID=A0A7K1Y0L4_9SPHI|nr:serine/threonine-protein kinase [Hufsiella ginkgonis]MXV16773.1 protein kinase [Hufsiella ginkgonis]